MVFWVEVLLRIDDERLVRGCAGVWVPEHERGVQAPLELLPPRPLPVEIPLLRPAGPLLRLLASLGFVIGYAGVIGRPDALIRRRGTVTPTEPIDTHATSMTRDAPWHPHLCERTAQSALPYERAARTCGA